VEQRRLEHDDLAAETVDRRSRHDVDVDEIRIRLARLLDELEPGDDPPAVRPEIMPAPHVALVGLLVLEVDCAEVLARIVVVPLDVVDCHLRLAPRSKIPSRRMLLSANLRRSTR